MLWEHDAQDRRPHLPSGVVGTPDFVTVRLLQTAGNGPLTSVLTFSEHPFGDGALDLACHRIPLHSPDGGDRHALGMVARPP